MAGSSRPKGIGAADLLRSALDGVRLYRIRSTLTLCSFAAGTAAAIALVAITGGARAELLERLGRLGTDLLRVRAVGARAPLQPPALTLADGRAIADALPFVDSVAPVRIVDAQVLLPDDQFAVQVVGTSSDYFSMRGMHFARGRTFTKEEGSAGAAVCIVGRTTAQRLATRGEVYGSLVKIEERWYRVVGILDADTFTSGETGDRRIYVPIGATLRGDLSPRQSVGEILVRIDEEAEPEASARVLRRMLSRRHGGGEPFAVETAEALLEQRRGARSILDRLLGAIAFGALLLGSVALAGQTWQSVSLRRAEIAIRRAVGARRADILLQFLLEGITLAALGAGAGLVLGLLGSLWAAALGGWSWLVPTGSLAAMLGTIALLGVGASIYPAYRAATLDPVEALRDER
jgi:putative ABC transport system permease protein